MLPRQESNIFPQNRKDAILSNNFTLFITVFGIIKAWIGATTFLPFSLVFHFDEYKVECDFQTVKKIHMLVTNHFLLNTKLQDIMESRRRTRRTISQRLNTKFLRPRIVWIKPSMPALCTPLFPSPLGGPDPPPPCRHCHPDTGHCSTHSTSDCHPPEIYTTVIKLRGIFQRLITRR